MYDGAVRVRNASRTAASRAAASRGGKFCGGG